MNKYKEWSNNHKRLVKRFGRVFVVLTRWIWLYPRCKGGNTIKKKKTYTTGNKTTLESILYIISIKAKKEFTSSVEKAIK